MSSTNTRILFGSGWLSLRRWLAMSLACVFSTVIILSVGAMFMPTAAAARAETRSRVVSYQDIDLAAPDGMMRVKRRIRVVARQLCDEPATSTFAVYRPQSDCVDTATARAMRQLRELAVNRVAVHLPETHR